MYGLIGLGNPDQDYFNTWHNVGKQFLQFLFSFTNPTIIKKNTYVVTYKITTNIIAIYPNRIYMNNIGTTLKKQIKFLNLKQLIIIHDDISIPLGKYKITPKPQKQHNGVKSFNSISLKKLYIKIGINTPFRQKYNIPLHSYVLSKINTQQERNLHDVFLDIRKEFLTSFLTNPDVVLQGYQ